MWPPGAWFFPYKPINVKSLEFDRNVVLSYETLVDFGNGKAEGSQKVKGPMFNFHYTIYVKGCVELPRPWSELSYEVPVITL